MDDKLTLVVAGNELTFRPGETGEYIKSLVTGFNADVSEMQLSHTKSTKLEAILMCALNYLDDKKKLEAENAALKRENEELQRRAGRHHN